MTKQVDQTELSNKLANKAGVPEKQKTIFDLIQTMEVQFQNALPEHVGFKRFMRVALTIVRTNPKLQMAEPMSVMGALMQAAQLGLEPNTPTKECYIIPYNNSRMVNGNWTKVMEAQFQFDYRGILKLVWNSGMVKEIDCDMICENDEVIYEKGRDGTFRHIPNLKEDRGEPYAYYAYAVTKDGGFVCTVWSKQQVLAHAKQHSKTYKKATDTFDGPWETDFDPMALKTMLIQLADKKLPKSPEYQQLHQAMSADETTKREVSEDMSEVIDVTDWDNKAGQDVDEEASDIPDSIQAEFDKIADEIN